MRKFFSTTLLATVACVGMAQQKCQITGHIDGVASDSLYVMVINKDYNDYERVDTVALNKGEVDYSIECDRLRLIHLVPVCGDLNSSYGMGNKSVLAMPGEKAVLSGNAKAITVGGSKFYCEYDEFNRLSEPINKRIEDLNAEYGKRIGNGENRDSVSADIEARRLVMEKELGDVSKKFIMSHPASHVSGYLLASLKADERPQYAAAISDEVKNGPTAPYCKMVEAFEAKMKALEEAARKTEAGNLAPDFVLPTIDGKQLSLASLRGKYVVIDFWGSWCGWCIKGMPEMKKYYEKYKDKGLEILGIDCNDTEEKWKAAVERNALPWLHVRNTSDTDVAALYGVRGFPTKLVIDKDGKIVKVVEGEDPQFYTFLDELFGGK